ncbi:MAG: adenylosuccinate lyase [Rhodothermales bacterium]|nr:adenylosuccinate lyase [Rhodothermales bacterium]MBO6778527.1 adenylosuccinate lyase [Rhodothermales bacterium]
MIERYSRPEMAALWTEEAQFDAWLEVELAACWAWSQLGVIPAEDVEKLYAKASFNVERIHEIEETTRHDVVAFTRSVSESLGPERKWVHYGLTSSDVVDTAWSVRLKKANALLLDRIDHMIDVLARRAREHKYTLMMGRTHGVHAEPTTFGLKMALYYAEMRRNRARFTAAAEDLRVGKISGSVGTFAHLPTDVERLTCERLGLEAAPISTQVLQRDRHAHYLSVLALIGATMEKMAVEVRGLQKSEVREVEEAFRKGQKGSSSMPHKRNPVGSENITGCARLLRGYMIPAFENVALWHERDISHSSAERVILPDATTVLHYALDRQGRLMDNLVVFPENMRENMERTFGLYNSQRVLNALINKGLVREKAYDAVQPLAMKAWTEKRSFRDLVDASPEIAEYLSGDEIAAEFDVEYHLQRVDEIFERVGLG